MVVKNEEKDLYTLRLEPKEGKEKELLEKLEELGYPFRKGDGSVYMLVEGCEKWVLDLHHRLFKELSDYCKYSHLQRSKETWSDKKVIIYKGREIHLYRKGDCWEGLVIGGEKPVKQARFEGPYERVVEELKGLIDEDLI